MNDTELPPSIPNRKRTQELADLYSRACKMIRSREEEIRVEEGSFKDRERLERLRDSLDSFIWERNRILSLAETELGLSEEDLQRYLKIREQRKERK